MNRSYQITSTKSKASSRELARFLTKGGQLLLPMVELIEEAECAVDDLVERLLRVLAERDFSEKDNGPIALSAVMCSATASTSRFTHNTDASSSGSSVPLPGCSRPTPGR